IDVSRLSEEDFGIAFINLPEEQKKAVLLEMGYSNDQIESILESCKGQKGPAAGSAFARTLVDRIAGKNRDKYHSVADRTGLGKSLGLAGLKKPGQRDFGIANTNSEKYDAASAAGGATSKDKPKSKQKPPKNTPPTTSDNSESDSDTSGNDTTEDPYAEYKKTNPEVYKKIYDILDKFEDDPYQFTAEGSDWNEFDDVTKEALAAIYDNCMDKIGESLDESECEMERIIAAEILHTTANLSKENYPYAFNSEKIGDLLGHLKPNTFGYEMATQLRVAKIEANDNLADMSYLDIRFQNAGISFSFKDWNDSDSVSEFYLYTSKERIINYIEKCEAENPDCFKYSRSIMSDDEIISMYNCAKTSEDEAMIDRLMKTNSKYENVFVGKPNDISDYGAYALGTYGNNLLWLAKEKGGAYETCYNNFLSQLVTYHDEEHSYENLPMKYNPYIEKYNIGCSMVTNSYLVTAWATSESEYDEELIKLIENAKENEMISFALYNYALEEEDAVGAEIKVIYYIPEENKENEEDDKLSYKGPRVSGLNIRNINRTHLWSTQKASEMRTVQLNSCYDAEAKDIEDKIELEELKKKQHEALIGMGVDFAIDVVGIFCPPLGIGLSIADLLMRSDPSNLVGQAADNIDNTVINLGASLYEALSDYQSYYDDSEMTKENWKGNAYSSAFYTCHYYNNVGGGGNYYLKMDDLGVIRAIQNWSKNGIDTVYKDEVVTYITDNREIIEKAVNEELSNNYTTDVNRALNTIIDGFSENGETYKSILDIPEEIFRVCIEQINDTLKFTDYTTVQAAIESQRSDYKDVQDSVSSSGGNEEAIDENNDSSDG
ncbi:MAG: hypothetical protein K5754_10605, partial [Butyrivibrio sp.]|nr:hypothetical protein [Butyrivibrio sp.]